MRITTTVILAVVPAGPASIWAADDNLPMVSLPIAPVASPAPAGGGYSSAQIARASAWIRELAPACPPAVTGAAAQSFLDELHERSPDLIDRMLAPDFPMQDLESTLLRNVSLHLTGSAFVPLREELARRRAQLVLARGGLSSSAPPARLDALQGKIKALSDTRYRALLEGQMDDDDLAFYLKRADDSGAPRTEPAALGGPSASAIVAEYTRRNQTGSALQRWRAYVVEARLQTATGEAQQLSFYRLRPDRFRLTVGTGGVVRFVQAGDGEQFWQQVPGSPIQTISRTKMGSRRYLAEFVDPLFSAEGYAFERLPDGGSGNARFFRIRVRRSDDSTYVARIDAQSYRQIGREEADGSIVSFSDFREVSGVTFAFREEVTNQGGQKGSMTLTRITVNPGLIEDFFTPSPQGEQVFFYFENMLAQARPVAGQPHP